MSTPPLPPRADPRAEYDYVVVGSGAGGAPLAANLARAGYRVLVLEAGDWDEPESCQVPGFHALSTEEPSLSWEFFVRHYSDDKLQASDTKYVAQKQGVFYPRAATVGGCTLHNAMITIAGPRDDWDDLADLTGDDSWRGERMRPYFQRLERCTYLPRPAPGAANSDRHGFDGWLTTSWPDLKLAAGDLELVGEIMAALKAAGAADLASPRKLLHDLLHGRIRQDFDPNSWRTLAEMPEGLALVPMAVGNGTRSSPRDLLRQALKDHADRLIIQTRTLVKEVLFEDPGPGKSAKPRAAGVRFWQGTKPYRAHPQPDAQPGQEGAVYCRREVILCGGAFNTPQLLMLSGIGPPDELARHGIRVRAALPGVGANLQDRYEIAVISEMKHDFALLQGASFREPGPGTPPDPDLQQWRAHRTGVYATNGVVLGILKRSRPEIPDPDLFIFLLPGFFKGYEPGYSRSIAKEKNLLTWAILKAHTSNHKGEVRLRSADPLDPPLVNFRFFTDGSSAADDDLQALVAGVKFVRTIENRSLTTRAEIWPGQQIQTDQQLKDWIRHEAWGHHACGTCRIGPADDPGGVLDSRFRVRGIDGLRVVDASIFPKIPGMFIVANIYMVSEKASDVIIEDNHGGPDDPVYPKELAKLEQQAVRQRRQEAGLAPTGTADDQPAATVGLALSGGGVRSATFNLGILQALARNKLLRQIDFLSTVSGGGYVGGFLGRFFTRFAQQPVNAAEHVEQRLTDPESHELLWLRTHANYIAPAGYGNLAVNAAIYLRNFLTLQFVVGVLLFSLFGLANLVRYGFSPWFDRLLPEGWSLPNVDSLPVGQLLQGGSGTFWSPWFVLVELLFLLAIVPLAVGYWLASQDKPESYDRQPLAVAFVITAALLFAALAAAGHISLQPLFGVLPLLVAFIWVERAWSIVRQRVRAAGPMPASDRSQMARTYLTQWLGDSLKYFAILFTLALADSLGAWTYTQARAANPTLTMAKASAILIGLLPVLRFLAGFLGNRARQLVAQKGLFGKTLHATVPGLLFFVIALFAASLLSYLCHWAYDNGASLGIGMAATLLALLVSIILGTAITFINRSSIQQTYAVRLGRTYLGATNPERRRDRIWGQDVTEVMPGDDLALRVYTPHERGGPLHLINVMLNHSTDDFSERTLRDRRGESMAVSPFGFSFGKVYHALWGSTEGQVVPVNVPAAEPHPLGNQPTAHTAEPTLQTWVAISGAAISPGRGAETNVGLSLLLGLANLRTGYWWDSNRPRNRPRGYRHFTWLTKLRWTFARFFLPQDLLLNEFLGRFGGPWVRYWYLSDGGFFENLGVYELLRRRVPYILCCDAGEDSEYDFVDLANLIRKARIDFAADIRFLTAEEIQNSEHIPGQVKPLLGPLEGLKPAGQGSHSQRHAALALIRYGDDPTPRSALLYLKSSLTGDEDPDILSYALTHPEFPHDSTADQFFTEPQWESYRRLGEHIGGPLFARGPSGGLWLADLLQGTTK